MTINREMAQESADFLFAHLVWMTFVVKENSPREIVPQACLEITFSPRAFEIFLALRCISSIKATLPVYQLERSSPFGRSN